MDKKMSEEKRDQKMTIEDVAKELGVAASTVSRAISGKGRIGKATRERVLQYIREHDYKPNLIAKSLAESRTFNLGVVIPAIRSPPGIAEKLPSVLLNTWSPTKLAPNPSGRSNKK